MENQRNGKRKREREEGKKRKSERSAKLEDGTQKVLLELKPTLRNYLLLRTY